MIYDCFCRRAAGGKFVPPVKRDQEEDINEEIRSRVLYGSNKGSGNGAESSKGLPPELEGDERLKNVEPRMVELIMNEVHGLVFCLPTIQFLIDCSIHLSDYGSWITGTVG